MKKNLHDNNNMPDSITDKQILERVSQYQPPFTLTKEDALKQLKQKIASGTKVVEMRPKRNLKTLYWIGSAAASILIIVAVWFTFIRKPIAEVVASNGEHSECQLPDGSIVNLNAGSTITYDKKHFNEKRKLFLTGEAFFNVKKGSSFKVETAKGSITVLGTSFNVYSRNDELKVSCVTGKVLVNSVKQAVIITPGESAELENDKLMRFTEKDLKTIATWRQGEFVYENTSLVTIFNEIERQYNVTFALPNINDKYFTGSFSNRNLVDALDIVCIPMGLTYEIGSNSKIIINEKQE